MLLLQKIRTEKITCHLKKDGDDLLIKYDANGSGSRKDMSIDGDPCIPEILVGVLASQVQGNLDCSEEKFKGTIRIPITELRT